MTTSDHLLFFSSLGSPHIKLNWLKKDFPMSNNSFVLLNGSLLLTNITEENEGSYMCIATNALGKTVAMTALHLSGSYQDL